MATIPLRRLDGVAVAFTLSALLLAPAAQASPTFPPAIETVWGISRFPASAGREGCLLCHATDAGGVVGTPFGRTVKARGATGRNDLTSLSRALNAIRTAGTDSDGDDISDYVELARDRTDPNDPEDFVVPQPSEGGAAGGRGDAGASNASGGFAPLDPPEPPSVGAFPRLPQHGCTVPARPGADSERTALLAYVMASWLASRRRRRRRIDTRSQPDRAENVSCTALRAPVHSRGQSAHGHR